MVADMQLQLVLALVALMTGLYFLFQAFQISHSSDVHFALNSIASAVLAFGGTLVTIFGVLIFCQSLDESAV